jgi:hypothetical protein
VIVGATLFAHPAAAAAQVDASPPAAPHAEAAPDPALRAIHDAVDAGRPKAAAAQFAALLADPARREWALAQREVLHEEARRIAFWSSYAPPALGTLISGRLDEWVPRTGAIALTYQPERLADFEVTGDGALVHQLVFSGDYTVAARGSRYPDATDGVRLLVDSSPAVSFCVTFGHARQDDTAAAPVQILRLTPAATQRIAALADSPLVAGAAYRVGVRVAAASIEALVDGKVVLRADKRGAGFGRVGLWPFAFTELRLAGTATAAWLDGRADRHRQAAMQAFAASFDPSSVLPAWLLDAGAPAATEMPQYPCAVAEPHAEELAALVALLEHKQYAKCLEQAAASALPASLVMWLRALAFAAQRDFAHALVCTQELLAASPQFLRGRELEGRLLWGTGQRDAALAKTRALVREYPDYVDAVAALISFTLCSGQRAAAAKELAAARARGLASDELERVAHTLAKAERGPDWPRRFTHRGRHCAVSSDIDQRVCVEVANTLTEAFATFTAELGALHRSVQPVQVFVFAGENSYRSYLADVLGTVPIHTTGIYSHTLGQLLLWQTPERARMLQTARHEGLHWYLEQVLPAPPRWLNEGLAQYYETASARGERAGAANLRALRIASLRDQKLLPLAQFFARSDGEFYADPALSYAQSWAMVTFLREGTQAQRAVLPALIAALQRGIAHAEALTAVLPEPKLDALDRELRAWLDAQR